MQEVFARFLRSEALDRVENPAAYFSRITRNLLIDRTRRKRHGMPIFFPFDDERDASARADQTWRIEAIDLSRLYRQTVRAMPPKTRRVFVMRRVKRMSYKEIAARLDISIATVDYHMVQALARCAAPRLPHNGDRGICRARPAPPTIRKRAETSVSPGSGTDFAAFYRAERGWLFHYFRRKIGRDAAPDLVQEAFTWLLRSGAFDRVEYPRPYLARIAHNLLIERARKIMREEALLVSLTKPAMHPWRPSRNGMSKQWNCGGAYRRALRLLSRKRLRRIFLMHRLRGMTYRNNCRRNLA